MPAQAPDPVSSSALARQLNLPSRSVFNVLLEHGLVEKADDAWALTETGRAKGGDYRESKQFGRYIVWPMTIADDDMFRTSAEATEGEAALSSTAIGKEHALSAQKVNAILSELGWIRKGVKGWVLTPQGTKLGGEQHEHDRTGIPYGIRSSQTRVS